MRGKRALIASRCTDGRRFGDVSLPSGLLRVQGHGPGKHFNSQAALGTTPNWVGKVIVRNKEARKALLTPDGFDGLHGCSPFSYPFISGRSELFSHVTLGEAEALSKKRVCLLVG